MSVWRTAAKPRWWQDRAREANAAMETDPVFENFRKKYKIPKSNFKMLTGLAAMKGAEMAVKSLHAELNNPFEGE